MVATTDCAEKSKTIAGSKVSKPVMEKKRRARINKCLDQLKSLLESYYSSSIRKRKLEKADILELTVKHLRNLQKAQSFSTPAAEFPDYHAGFHSCLANFNQYLLMADNLNRRERCTLSQLSSKLCRSAGAQGDASSTMDSGRGPADAPPAGPEEPEPAERDAPGAPGANTSRTQQSEDARRAPGTKHAAESTKHAGGKHPVQKRSHSVSSHCGSDASGAASRVWRPW